MKKTAESAKPGAGVGSRRGYQDGTEESDPNIPIDVETLSAACPVNDSFRQGHYRAGDLNELSRLRARRMHGAFLGRLNRRLETSSSAKCSRCDAVEHVQPLGNSPDPFLVPTSMAVVRFGLRVQVEDSRSPEKGVCPGRKSCKSQL
jgi:hypothetical protein